MRRLFIAAALVTALAAVPSTASARAFSYGVSSAEVTDKSAVLWGRALKAGNVQLEVALNKKFTQKRITKTVLASTDNDLTVQTQVTGLKPNSTYYYFFHQGKQRSLLGKFRTAPTSTAKQTIRFAVTGDADGVKGANGQLFWNRDGANNFATYKAMAAEKNDFNVNLGDTIYSDATSDAPTKPPIAFSLDQKRQLYRQNLNYANLVKLRQTGSVYNQWDDHEFMDDFNRQSEGFCDAGSIFNDPFPCDMPALYTAGVKAFQEYMPVSYSADLGTYRTFRWGKNLQIFILDERSFRSLRASEVKDDPSAPEPTSHVCENPPGSGQDDPGPQIPQRLRNLFAILYKPVGNPARPECLAALNDPNRTMLGAAQYSAFTTAIKNSTATWKVIINEVPMMEFGINPYDDWQGYEAEREKLLTFLKSNVKNVAIVTTDFHTNWVNDARIKTFPEDGGPINSGIKEFVAGGVSDSLFGREVDAFTKSKNSYKLIDSAFLLNKPPNGVGMECSNMVTYGYAQLEASAKTLKVVLRDNKGKQMRMASNNKPCGPWTLKAKK